MNPFLTLHYYFNPYPGSGFQFSKIILAGCLVVFLLGIFILFYRKKKAQPRHKKWIQTYGKRIINMAIVALGLLFVREVGIPYFSMRLWWGIWAIMLLIFSFMALKQFRKANRLTLEIKPKAQDPRAKYLPKKKKHK